VGLTGLSGVTVAFGDGPPTLRGITLLVAPGEIVTVLGPSGSGKTTVLRTVAGLEGTRAGRVLVAGRDVTRVPTPQRNVAMVFQESTLVPFLDVAANLARVTQAADAQSTVRGLGLRRLLPRMPRTLSPGESGRAGIGRALVREPAAFLFDEPVAHLDSAERSRVRRTIVDAVRRAGVAALWVTHDQTEAMAVGDRLAVLRDGAVVQVDTPSAMYERPVDVFVAGFVGTPGIGLLPATATPAGYRVGPRTLPLWGPLPAGVDEGRAVLLGLRAEDVTAGDAPDPASVLLPVTVADVERPMPEAVLVADLAVPGAADGARIVARVDPGTRVRRGDRVELAVDARRAHVFDAGTGLALAHPCDAGRHRS
jgi:multiple sugar transport system ATP-binding protein